MYQYVISMQYIVIYTQIPKSRVSTNQVNLINLTWKSMEMNKKVGCLHKLTTGISWWSDCMKPSAFTKFGGFKYLVCVFNQYAMNAQRPYQLICEDSLLHKATARISTCIFWNPVTSTPQAKVEIGKNVLDHPNDFASPTACFHRATSIHVPYEAECFRKKLYRPSQGCF